MRFMVQTSRLWTLRALSKTIQTPQSPEQMEDPKFEFDKLKGNIKDGRSYLYLKIVEQISFNKLLKNCPKGAGTFSPTTFPFLTIA